MTTPSIQYDTNIAINNSKEESEMSLNESIQIIEKATLKEIDSVTARVINYS